MKEKAFQDYMEQNECWGCGKRNNFGLQIKSYWDGDNAVCIWMPSKHYKAGPKDYLNGGIIASVIDCHSVCTAIADAYRTEGREMDSEPFIWYVTASLNIKYLKPTAISKSVKLVSNIMERKGKKSYVECSLYSEDVKCVTGEVLAVRVQPENWY